MTTLTTAPVAPLLDRLYAAAEADDPAASPAFAAVSEDDRAALLRDPARYRELYGALNGFALAVSRDTGRLLYMLARARGARAIVEFGTSFGLSTIHLAAALRDNGGGRLITSEFEAAKIARAKANLTEADLADLVNFRAGDALDTLARDLPEAIDLVLLDGAKSLYDRILDRLEPHLKPGALIVADNADMCPTYLERVRAAGGGYLSVPFAEDVELTMRL